MLTDEEIKIIYDEYEREIDAGHTVSGFARAIERAVLKKLGEQDPEYYLFAEELYHRESEALSDYVRQEAEKLYAHPLPAQAVPEKMQYSDDDDGDFSHSYVNGYNDAIDAMLSAAQKP